MKITKDNKRKEGISMITLVITIIIVVILAGVVILTLSKNNPIESANEATFKQDMQTIKEEYTAFLSQKALESNGAFDPESLIASQITLTYNTKRVEEGGNIETVIPSAKKYIEKIQILRGEILFTGDSQKELIWAKEIGIAINPFEVNEGELVSSNVNLGLIDSEGKITIPGNVTKIGEGAFSNVEGLKEVVIPGTVKKISKNAFANNNTLERVIIEEGCEEVGAYAFKECRKLNYCKMADSINNLELGVFMGCSSLKEVNIPNRIKDIPIYFVYSCALENIIIPESVERINAMAFGNNKISNIYIPKNVEYIGNAVFNGCNNLENIEMDSSNQYFEYNNGILIGKKDSGILYITKSKLDNKILEIPNEVKVLGSFSATNNIVEEIKISSTVLKIDFSALESFTSLKKITIDNDNLKYCNDGNGVYSKDKVILYAYISDETSISINENVKVINNGAISFSPKVTKILLPETLENINYMAFKGCQNITSLDIGKNVKSIDSLAIYSSSITNLNIDPQNPYYIFENNMLFNKEKTKLVIYCGRDEKVQIPKGVEEIGNFVFHARFSLKQIIIPNTVKVIGDSFNYCSSLEYIEIPNSIETIASNCFENSTNLKQIRIHKKKGEITGSPWGSIYGDRIVIWDE